MTIVYLVPRGQPSPFAVWSEARPHAILIERETDTDWYGKPTDNSMCPTLQWPKFAWEQYTAQDAIRDILGDIGLCQHNNVPSTCLDCARLAENSATESYPVTPYWEQ